MTTKGMIELCNIYYNEKTMDHAYRVAKKAKSLSYLFKTHFTEDFIFQLGLAHDLYEDTNIKQGVWFDPMFELNLQLLTREKYENYNDYIEKIFNKTLKNPTDYLPAYIVKLADMHDHFEQKDTLTEELKEKYVAAIPYLF